MIIRPRLAAMPSKRPRDRSSTDGPLTGGSKWGWGTRPARTFVLLARCRFRSRTSISEHRARSSRAPKVQRNQDAVPPDT